MEAAKEAESIEVVQQLPPALLRLDFGCGMNKRQDGGDWTGVDVRPFPGVDVVLNLVERDLSTPMEHSDGRVVTMPGTGRYKPWPWADNSVSEGHASHFVEHLTGLERVHFVNELWRVLVPGGKATIVCPHWASCRAYGDFTHQWPPVGEFWPYYLSREWRVGAEKTCPSCGGTKAVAQHGRAVSCQQCGGQGKIKLGANAPHNDIAWNPDGYTCDFEVTWGYGDHPEVALKAREAREFSWKFYKEAVQDIVLSLTAKK
jgi:hypothetical protein